MSDEKAHSRDRHERLDALLAVYLEAAGKGQPPDREVWLALYPDLAEELARFLDTDERVRRLVGAQLQQGTPSDSREPITPTVALEADRVAGSSDPDAGHAPGSEIVPGYEILGELGRGGMGVVYKARQVSLNRVVALKMVLAKEYAGPDERSRFRSEAEAIARLQHPGIIQVFEVGEHQGQAFIALEYCPEGSLDRKLAGTPVEAREAARLVERLAWATHAAHQASVVHRDLKPGNVLLVADAERTTSASASSPLAGLRPKLTDFGLAKKLDQSGQTQTGAVMGTPSYMAPEQAQGKKDVGPLADVYALGAILYECLTGRPPFLAATTFDTLMQVVSQEPVAPRELNAQVPRDLETVCLKCLRKEPGQRYASAAELALDLRRWQVGEPIRARRLSTRERVFRWIRKKPGLALALGFALLLFAGSTASALLPLQRVFRGRIYAAACGGSLGRRRCVAGGSGW